MVKTDNDEVRRQMGPTGKEKTRITAVMLVILLTGCEESKIASALSEPKRPHIVEARTSAYAADIVVVELEDGTRCAAMLGFNKGGLSCDWKGAK